jgi:hypothetical protein
MHQQWEHPCLSYTQLQSMLQDEIIYTDKQTNRQTDKQTNIWTEIFLFKFDSYSVIRDSNYLANIGHFM